MMSAAPSIVGDVIDEHRGVLYPQRMPRFHRLPAPPAVAHLISWFWIPEWDLAPGETSRQDVVAYPALNLVVERAGIEFVGATTRASHRDLVGTGWAVGAMLRPAAVAALTENPAALRDTSIMLNAPELLDALVPVMDGRGDGRLEAAVGIMSQWLVDRAGAATDAELEANVILERLMTDADLRTAEEVAARMAVSLRTLQRLTHRHVGLPPLAMIRRRRLQEAAQRLREDPGTELAALAAELGYADHAHLTRDFREVLGIVPSGYRQRI